MQILERDVIQRGTNKESMVIENATALRDEGQPLVFDGGKLMESSSPGSALSRAVRSLADSAPGSRRRPIIVLEGTTPAIAELTSMLAGRHRVVSLNFGDSSENQGSSGYISTLEESFLGFSAETKVILVAWSNNVPDAILLAAKYPEKVEKLILISGWMKADSYQQFVLNCLSGSQQASSAHYQRMLVSKLFSVRFIRDLNHEALEGLAGVTSDFKNRIKSIEPIDVSSFTQKITSPALIIGATNDLIASVDQSEELYGAIEKSELVYVPTGHASVFERPAQLFHLVDAFVDGESITAVMNASGSTFESPLVKVQADEQEEL